MNSPTGPEPPAPMPPLELARRVGALEVGKEAEQYEELSSWLRKEVVLRFPPGWTFDGKRVLDFGCGAGRVLRGFMHEASSCEFYGCDIDGPSVDWLRENLSPPFRVFRNGGVPPLPFEAGSLDLIYAVSVFTHLTDAWAAWLLELHRCLTPDGVFIASLMGGAMSQPIAHQRWDPDRVGMAVFGDHRPWDQGGPMVLHSPWWVRAHWGRAFTITHYDEAVNEEAHDWVVLRKKLVELSVADLETPEPAEPRELAAGNLSVGTIARRRAPRSMPMRSWLRSVRSRLSRKRGKP